MASSRNADPIAPALISRVVLPNRGTPFAERRSLLRIFYKHLELSLDEHTITMLNTHCLLCREITYSAAKNEEVNILHKLGTTPRESNSSRVSTAIATG